MGGMIKEVMKQSARVERRQHIMPRYVPHGHVLRSNAQLKGKQLVFADTESNHDD